jgi:hypothetical protein
MRAHREVRVSDRSGWIGRWANTGGRFTAAFDAYVLNLTVSPAANPARSVEKQDK